MKLLTARRKTWLTLLLSILPLPLLLLAFWYAVPCQPRVTLKPDGPTHLKTVSPDGRFLATTNSRTSAADTEGPVRVWDLHSGYVRLTLAPDWKRVPNVHFSPDGKLLAAGDEFGQPKVWDVTTGEELPDLGCGYSVGIDVGSCFSPDGRLLVFEQRLPEPAGHGVLKFWDIASRTIRAELLGSTPWHMRFAPDGRTLALDRPGGRWRIHTVQLWRLGNEGEPLTLLKEHSAEAVALAFSSDLRMFATVENPEDDDERWLVQLRDLSSGAVLAKVRLAKECRRVFSLRFGDGDRLLIADRDSRRNPGPTTIVWRVDSGLEQHMAWDEEGVFSSDDRWVVRPDTDGVSLCDPTSGAPVSCWHAPGDRAYCLGIDGHSFGPLVTFGPDRRTLIVHGLLCRDSLAARINAVRAGQFQEAMSGRQGCIARLWQVDSGESLAVFDGDTPLFSSDGQSLVLLHHDGSICVWDVPPKKPWLGIVGLSVAGGLLLLSIGYLIRLKSYAGRTGSALRIDRTVEPDAAAQTRNQFPSHGV
jgi:WD40 repeat protein